MVNCLARFLSLGKILPSLTTRFIPSLPQVQRPNALTPLSACTVQSTPLIPFHVAGEYQPVQLPAHTEVPVEALTALAEQHGLPVHPIRRMPDTGIFNAIYLLGDDFILRFPRQHPLHYQALWNESIAVPLARHAGVRTPALLVYDDSCTLLPVPYTIYARIHGETLGHLDLEPEDTPWVWRELGRDLARLHRGVEREGPAATLTERKSGPEPRELAETLAVGGWITGSEARWLQRWLDHIAPAALTPVQPRLCHGDTQTTNIMVDSPFHRYAAVLDWGSTGWSDPAWDFAGIPLRAVPFLLEGYRAIAPLEADAAAEARILWRHVQLALFTAQRAPQPAHSWAERPLPMLLEIARFFLSCPPDRWQELRPQ